MPVALNQLSPQLLQWLLQQPPADTDAPWVQNLKRLVQPNVDPRALVQPQYQNTDPGLNRQGPVVGDWLNT